MAEPFVIAEFVPAQKISDSVKVTVEADGWFRFDTKLLSLGKDGDGLYGVYGSVKATTLIRAVGFSEAMKQYLDMQSNVSVGGMQCL